MAINRVTGLDSLNRLTDGLFDPSRKLPWCIISIPAKTSEPIFDPKIVFEQTEGVCEIWVIDTGFLSYELASILPAGCEVFGGSARVYPPGLAWTTEPSLAKRRFGDQNARAIGIQTERLIADIQSAAFFAGLFTTRTSTTQTVTGTIKKFYANGETAVVQLEDGTLTSLAAELTVPGMSLEALLEIGQRVSGTFDSELRRFLLPISTITEKQILEHFPSGTVTLGRVKEVERRTASIEIFPSYSVTITRDEVSSNPKDKLDLFFTPGDVVEVRILRNAQGRLALRMFDIDDDEPVEPPIAIVPGGKPWLGVGSVELVTEDELQSEPIESFLARFGLADADLTRFDEELAGAEEPLFENHEVTPPTSAATQPANRPVPGPGPRSATPSPVNPAGAQPDSQISDVIAHATDLNSVDSLPSKSIIQSLNLTIASLKSQVISLKARLGLSDENERREQQLAIKSVVEERDSARRQLRGEKEKTAELRKELRSAKQQQIVGLDYEENRANFSPGPEGDEEWMRFEIYLAWISRIPSHSRKKYKLKPFSLGAEFIESFNGMTRGKKNKALKALVDVITGNDELLASREVHALREGSGAGSKERVRTDGARCMRAYIEENAAAARRLHYWVLPSGEIELSRCVTHDDFEP